MAVDVRVRGTEQLARLSQRLKQAGNGALKRELLRELRNAVKPAIPDVRASARSRLPKAGGLADLIADSKMAVRTRLTGASAGVRLQATSPYAIGAINRGRLRHPVYGTKTLVVQKVDAGWWDDPLKKRHPRLVVAVRQAMREVAQQIEK